MYQVDAGAANDTLHNTLTLARNQHQGSKNVVFYLGCGASGSRAPQTGFTLGDLVAGGAVWATALVPAVRSRAASSAAT